MAEQLIPLKRHPVHWHTNGSIIFQVDNILYCIHLSIIQQISPVFRDIFTIPVGTENGSQGTEANPIVLEQVRKEEFDDFLLWIYKINWSPPPHPERVYISLLKMSQLWQIDEGVAFAIHHLEKEFLPPARRIELGRMFSIHDWIKLAMKELIAGDLSSLSDEDTHRLGLKVYTILAKAREAMERERKLTSAYPPPMTFEESWECMTHETCRSTWREFWWKKIAKQLLHPMKPLPFDETVDFLLSSELRGMTASCKDAIIKQIRDSGFKDELILDGAVEAVVMYHKSLEM